MFCDLCHRDSAYFHRIVKRKQVIGPAFARQDSVRASLALHAPADAQKSTIENFSLDAGPATHAARSNST